MPASPAKSTAASLWENYRLTHSDSARNALMEHYLHLVRFNAERMHAKLPDEVELDDAMSSGLFGLMDAIAAFDPGRGIKFETYSAPRIRGAILDELRYMDWVPRLVRSRTTKMNRASKKLEQELGRTPTAAEIGDLLKLSPGELEKLTRDSSPAGLGSLSRKFFETESGRDLCGADMIIDKKTADPFREIQRENLKELLCRGLSRTERLIILLYYFEEMTMKKIGATLDLSESRVSQLHSNLIERLKVQVDEKVFCQ